MKKNIFICLILGLILCGCNSKTNINNNSSEIDSNEIVNTIDTGDDITVDDLKYLYTSYDYLNEFYKSFYYINDFIEDVNKEYYQIYLTLMNNTFAKIKEMTVPLKYVETHQYLVDAIAEYIEGSELLYDSYLNADINSYLEASDILTNALSVLDIYFAYIGEEFISISDFLSVLAENEYYYSAIDIYVYEENFTDEENEVLFALERKLKMLPGCRDELLDALFKGESIVGYIRTLKALRDDIKSISCSNENLVKYRDDIGKCLDVYVETLIAFSDMIESNTFSTEVVSEYVTTLKNQNTNIYMSVQGLSEFYKSYNIDIGFTQSIINGNTPD